MNNLIYQLTGPWACTVYVLLGIFTYSEFSTAKTYVEWKSQTKFQKIDELGKTIHFGRLGYKFKNNFYVEMGPRTGGQSLETGGKWKFTPNLALKWKVESSKTSKWKHGIETEVRYTF